MKPILMRATLVLLTIAMRSSLARSYAVWATTQIVLVLFAWLITVPAAHA